MLSSQEGHVGHPTTQHRRRRRSRYRQIENDWPISQVVLRKKKSWNLTHELA